MEARTIVVKRPFSQWPPDITPTPSREAKSEFKTSQSIITTAIPVQAQDNFDKLLEAHALRKVLRIGAWIQRFIRNCRTLSENRMTGLLEMSEIEDHNSWWIKRAQSSAENDVHFEEDKLQLNLQPNHHHVLECRGRIEGEYPIYLPDSHLYTHKLVEQAHLSTLHGGVAITMAKVREIHWVPRLRQLVKKIRTGCWGCK